MGLAGNRPLARVRRGAGPGLGGGGGCGAVAPGPFGLAKVEELAGIEWLGGRLDLLSPRVPLSLGGFQELEAEEAREFVLTAGGGLGGPGSGRAASPCPPREEFALQRDDLLQLHHVVSGQEGAGSLGLVGAVRGAPGALPFALALLVGRVLPGGLGLGLVTAGLTFLAGLVLGMPLPLLLLPLAPLLLLEVVLRLPLVLLSRGNTSALGTPWEAHPPQGCGCPSSVLGPKEGPTPASPTLKASRRWYSSLAISSATQAGMSGMATWMMYFRNRAKCCGGNVGPAEHPHPSPMGTAVPSQNAPCKEWGGQRGPTITAWGILGPTAVPGSTHHLQGGAWGCRGGSRAGTSSLEGKVWGPFGCLSQGSALSRTGRPYNNK